MPKIRNIFHLIVGSFALVLMHSCRDAPSPSKELDDLLVEYGEQDNKIDSTEIQSIADFVTTYDDRRGFRQFFPGGVFDQDKLVDYIVEKKYIIEEDPLKKDVNISLYIENSGSMNGYINGNTQFKSAIRDLLVMLKYHYGAESINLYFINSEVYSIGIDGDLKNFAQTLNKKTFSVGNTASSNLNNVFQQVLDRTSKDTIAILLSDCIYSIKGNKTEELLSDQKSLTKDAFLSKFKKDGHDLSTIIVKLTSAFNGKYYDKNDKPLWLGTGEIKRPYYLTIIGNKDIVVDFSRKIELSQEKIEGFENKYALTAQDFSENIFFAAVQALSDIGNWNYVKHTSGGNAIERVRVNGRASKPFTFSTIIDFSTLPIEEEYLMNPENYRVTEGNYKLVAVERYDKKVLKPQAEILIKQAHQEPTHRLVFQGTSKKYTDLTFSLKKHIPKWVEETYTDNDTDIRRSPNKTFGFRYLVEGISEAYETVSKSANNYFELTINIKNN